MTEEERAAEKAAEEARIAAEAAAAKRAAEDAILAALVVTEQPTLARPYVSATADQTMVEVKELGVRRSRPLVRVGRGGTASTAFAVPVPASTAIADATQLTLVAVRRPPPPASPRHGCCKHRGIISPIPHPTRPPPHAIP
jgi:hypothetical protein